MGIEKSITYTCDCCNKNKIIAKGSRKWDGWLSVRVCANSTDTTHILCSTKCLKQDVGDLIIKGLEFVRITTLKT